MTDARKTAIYCRAALTNDIAIARQEKQLREYAKEHGHAETVSFRDNGFSGNTLDRRLAPHRLFPKFVKRRLESRLFGTPTPATAFLFFVLLVDFYASIAAKSASGAVVGAMPKFSTR
ncbi:MAG: recombinase family protein [Clostridiales bacterium]|jgi:hypothetical protein|nr:recombinase family protein [Clostridiales bacterium]